MQDFAIMTNKVKTYSHSTDLLKVDTPSLSQWEKLDYTPDPRSPHYIGGSPGTSPAVVDTCQFSFDSNEESRSGSQFLIGDRVLVGKYRRPGTVAYVGPTHFSTLDVAGVALDENKGKHDGCAYGIRYFQCKPNRGVFTRLDALVKDTKKHVVKNDRIRFMDENTDSNLVADISVSQNHGSSAPRKRQQPSYHPSIDSGKSILSVVGKVLSNEKLDSKNNIRRTGSERIRSKASTLVAAGSMMQNGSKSSSRLVTQHSGGLKRSKTLPSVPYGYNAVHERPELRQLVYLLRSDASGQSQADLCSDNTSLRSWRSHSSGPNVIDLIHINTKSAQISQDRPKCKNYVSFADTENQPSKTLDLQMAYKSTSSSSADYPAFRGLSGYESDCSSQLAKPEKEANGQVCVVADSVVSCAQERLHQLLDELMCLHQTHNMVVAELQREKCRRTELSQAYEKRSLSTRPSDSSKADITSEKASSTSNFNPSSWNQLNEECGKSQNLLNDLRKLGYQVDCMATATRGGKDTGVHDSLLKEQNKSFPSVCYGEELVRLRRQQQLQYQVWLSVIAECLETVRGNLTEIRQSRRGKQTTPELLQQVRESQLYLLNEIDERIRRLVLQLSVIDADIAHLRGRPEMESRHLLQKLNDNRTFQREAEAHVQRLEEQIKFSRQEISRLKHQLSSESHRQLISLQRSFQSQQLQHLQSKAAHLVQEQDELLRKKTEELKDVTEDLDTKSGAWASERQLMLQTNKLLKEKLLQLTDRLGSTNEHGLPGQGHKLNKAFNGRRYRTSRPTSCDSSDTIVTYPFFGALCSEIRRLQTRATNLVDAIDTLSSGRYTAAQLESIKAYILGVKQTKNISRVVPHFCRQLQTDKDSLFNRPLSQSLKDLGISNSSSTEYETRDWRSTTSGRQSSQFSSNGKEINTNTIPPRLTTPPVDYRIRRRHMFANSKQLLTHGFSFSIPEVDDEHDV